MIDRGYRWDVDGLKDCHACTTCGYVKQRKYFGTVNTFRKDAEGKEVPYLYRRKECKECHNKKSTKGKSIKYLQPTTTTL